MKRKSYRKSILGLCLSLLLLAGVAAPQVFAYENEDDPYAYVPINQEPTDETMIGTVDELTGTEDTADTSSVVSEYNLASENWDELLGVETIETSAVESTTTAVESEESGTGMGAWTFAGNAESDGGISKIFIVAIIAFAVGAIGAAFFVYSQFIYKAKLRRKAAENGELMEDDWEEDPRDFQDQQPEQEEEPQPRPEQQEADPAEPAEPDHPSALSKEDEEKLKEIDWDSFFNDGM